MGYLSTDLDSFEKGGINDQEVACLDIVSKGNKMRR
jgi:hypothetical protein